MGKIDTPGVYRMTVQDNGITATKEKTKEDGTLTGGFPQLCIDGLATEKWVDDKEGMEYFKLEEPAWVDWSENDETARGYLMLAGEKGVIFHAEQVQVAFGWDGASFASIGDLTGKPFMARVEYDDYKDDGSCRITYIDSVDASPIRELSSLDADALKAMDKKFALPGAKKSAAKPAAAAKAKGKSASKPAAKSEETPKAKAEPKAPAAPPPPPAPAASGDGEGELSFFGHPVSEENAMADVWGLLHQFRGKTKPTELTTAWQDATLSIADGLDAESITPEMWVSIAVNVAEGLSLDVTPPTE